MSATKPVATPPGSWPSSRCWYGTSGRSTGRRLAGAITKRPDTEVRVLRRLRRLGRWRSRTDRSRWVLPPRSHADGRRTSRRRDRVVRYVHGRTRVHRRDAATADAPLVPRGVHRLGALGRQDGHVLREPSSHRTQARNREGDGLAPSTVAITAGRPQRRPDAPLNEAVTFASTFHAGGPVAYGRDGNPTWTAFEDALGALEGGARSRSRPGWPRPWRCSTRSRSVGLSWRRATAYYGTRNLLTAAPDGRWDRVGRHRRHRRGITSMRGRGAAVHRVAHEPAPRSRRSSGAVAGAHDRGALVAVDNTFATPLGQRPLDHGADVVVHSVTKFLAGHSDVILGATVTEPVRVDLHERLRQRRSRHGAVPGPMEVFLALRGCEPSRLRYERAERQRP